MLGLELQVLNVGNAWSHHARHLGLQGVEAVAAVHAVGAVESALDCGEGVVASRAGAVFVFSASQAEFSHDFAKGSVKLAVAGVRHSLSDLDVPSLGSCAVHGVAFVGVGEVCQHIGDGFALLAKRSGSVQFCSDCGHGVSHVLRCQAILTSLDTDVGNHDGGHLCGSHGSEGCVVAVQNAVDTARVVLHVEQDSAVCC